MEALSTLTSLTRLVVRMWGAPADLSQWTGLSALESVAIEVQDWSHQDATRFLALAPLAALSRLTSLVLHASMSCYDNWVCESQSAMSVLSQLAALRLLRYENIMEANFVREDLPPQASWLSRCFRSAKLDPLPVQLRVLTSATALETLHLEFAAAFWTEFSPDSCHAVHATVCSLHSLKNVRLVLWGYNEIDVYYHPLVTFTSSPSIQALDYECQFDTLPLAGRAPSCCQSLTQLSQLRLIMPLCLNCCDLLAGLPSRHLTSLDVDVQDITSALTEVIGRFEDIHELKLEFRRAISSNALKPLKNMAGLTTLEIRHPPNHQAEQPQLRGDAADLKAAVLEAACKLGVAARVKFGALLESAEAGC